MRALADSIQCRGQPCCPNNGRHHPICRACCRLQQCLATCGDFNPRPGQGVVEFRPFCLVTDNRNFRPELYCLRRQRHGVCLGCEGNNLVRTGYGPADQIKRAAPDRAR